MGLAAQSYFASEYRDNYALVLPHNFFTIGMFRPFRKIILTFG